MQEDNGLGILWESINAIEKRAEDDWKKASLGLEVLVALSQKHGGKIEKASEEIDLLTRLCDKMTQNIGSCTTLIESLLSRLAAAEQRIKELEDRPPRISGNP